MICITGPGTRYRIRIIWTGGRIQ